MDGMSRLSLALRKRHDFNQPLEEREFELLPLADGEVMMIENIRFDAGETKGDEDLAKRLAAPLATSMRRPSPGRDSPTP